MEAEMVDGEPDPQYGAFWDWLSHVGTGWWPLLAEAHHRLSAVWPQYALLQVKEKWGGLRIYLEYPFGDDAEQGHELWTRCEPVLTELESRSRFTCEFCGAPGVRRNTGWIKTLCDGCGGGAPVSPMRTVRTDWGYHHTREPENPLQ